MTRYHQASENNINVLVIVTISRIFQVFVYIDYIYICFCGLDDLYDCMTFYDHRTSG